MNERKRVYRARNTHSGQDLTSPSDSYVAHEGRIVTEASPWPAAAPDAWELVGTVDAAMATHVERMGPAATYELLWQHVQPAEAAETPRGGPPKGERLTVEQVDVAVDGLWPEGGPPPTLDAAAERLGMSSRWVSSTVGGWKDYITKKATDRK